MYLSIIEKDFIQACKRVQLCMSKDKDRLYLNGAYLHLKNGMWHLVATDVVKLAMIELNVVNSDDFNDAEMETGFVLERDFIDAICKLKVPKTNLIVTLDVTPKECKFITPSIIMHGKIVEGTYPNYTALFPCESESIEPLFFCPHQMIDLCKSMIASGTMRVQFVNYAANDLTALSDERGGKFLLSNMRK